MPLLYWRKPERSRKRSDKIKILERLKHGITLNSF